MDDKMPRNFFSMRIRKFTKYTVAFSLLYYVFGSDHEDYRVELTENPQSVVDYFSAPQPTKHILLYTPYMWSPNWMSDRGQKPFERCPINNCILTSMRNLSSEGLRFYDALLFNDPNLCFSKMPDAKERRAGQVYIYALHESPVHVRSNLLKYKSYFNWTMAYRSDSDVYFPNGYVASRDTLDPNQDQQILQRKKRLLFWDPQHCNFMEREYFVKKLENYLKISQISACLNYNMTDPNVIRRLQSFKFVLALETEECNEFISEHFWKYLDIGVVPIVYGGKNHAKLAPPNSFVDAKKFSSTSELVDYIEYLDENDEHYMKYHAWRKRFVIGTNTFERAFCEICMKLHDPSTGVKEYTDLRSWVMEGQCEGSGKRLRGSCPSQSADLKQDLIFIN